MSRLLLLEDYPEDFAPGDDDRIVAPSAKACYFPEETRSAMSHCHRWCCAPLARLRGQLLERPAREWLDRLDAALLKEATEFRPRVGPAILYGYHL